MSVTRWIGDYEVVRRLRVGGMASLYLARRHGAAGFSRLAAIKVIHPHLLDQPKFIDMFVDEARICSQITHPNVVHVQEFGDLDGVHYLVMEYIDGCSANELLQLLRAEERPLEPELAAHIVMQVARGLHAAHESQGPDGQPLEIIHRDITPSNILLSRDGHVKLIDFGIAKARNRVSETEAGFALKGKYRYVAPEQATRTDLDRRTDIFSLGVVFWELLTGEQLFEEDSHVGLFNRLQATTVKAPSEVNPASPMDLDPLVLAMLQHDRENRPPTALDISKWIAAAVPGAVTREAEEIGALVNEVREQRAKRASTEERLADESFSPVPRRSRPFPTRGPEDYQIEVVPPPQESITVAENAPRPPAPTTKRRPLIAIGGAVLAAGMLIGILLARGGKDDARDTVSPSLATDVPSSTTTPVTSDSPTPTPAPEPAIRAAVPAPSDPAPTAVAAPIPAPTASVTKTRATPVGPSRTRIAPAVPPKKIQTAAAPAMRAPDAKPPRNVVEEATVPVAKTQTFRAGTSTFVDTSFDDAANTTTSVTKPNRAKVKKTTIVTDFDD